MNTIPEPLYSLGSVDVNAIDPYTKRLGFTVHVNCEPNELQSAEIMEYSIDIVNRKINYLLSEQIIPDPDIKKWHVSIDTVGHKP